MSGPLDGLEDGDEALSVGLGALPLGSADERLSLQMLLVGSRFHQVDYSASMFRLRCHVQDCHVRHAPNTMRQRDHMRTPTATCQSTIAHAYRHALCDAMHESARTRLSKSRHESTGDWN